MCMSPSSRASLLWKVGEDEPRPMVFRAFPVPIQSPEDGTISVKSVIHVADVADLDEAPPADVEGACHRLSAQHTLIAQSLTHLPPLKICSTKGNLQRFKDQARILASIEKKRIHQSLLLLSEEDEESRKCVCKALSEICAASGSDIICGLQKLSISSSGEDYKKLAEEYEELEMNYRKLFRKARNEHASNEMQLDQIWMVCRMLKNLLRLNAVTATTTKKLARYLQQP